jgi:hypothetical protein
VIASEFDIRKKLFDAQGQLDEDAANDYEQTLARLFGESPEGKTLAAEGVELGFASTVVHFVVFYEGANLAQMTTAQFGSVMFDLIPRKVMEEPGLAQDMIRETRSFLAFLTREFEFTNTFACLATIEGDRGVARLRQALSDPRNWGMGKSLLMSGKSSGFEVSSKEGIEGLIQAYNASRPAQPRLTRGRKPVKAKPSRRKNS